jgi:hypothetical protein
MTSVLRRVRLSSVAVIAVALAIVVPGVSHAKVRELKVMTQNLYLGSSLDAAIIATTPGEPSPLRPSSTEPFSSRTFRRARQQLRAK